MKKIAVYYPYFMGGGAEAVVLWMLQGLQEKYDLTLFTVGNIDLKKLNSMYGTSLSSQNVKVIPLVSDMFRDACYFMMANNKELRMLFFHLLIRLFKQNSHNYDLVMCGYNAMDLGKVGIQYIHMTQVLEGTPLYRKISSFSKEDMLKNISITNSEHLANYTKKVYGIEPKVVYPPVVIDTPNIPWSEKEDAFICSGRIVEAKEPHRVIKILKMVREKGFDIKLHMTGGGGGVYGWKYDSLIKKMVKENQDWITIYENLPYKEYTELLAKCRYGIHFKKEPFGISIAEMVKAGAIPFVRGEGGQVEIVGKHNEELFFNKEQEAVAQIVNVLSNPNQQSKLCESLAQQKNLFSTHRFMSEFNEVVNSYFETVDS
ncbi:MAG: glycosyltransferase [Scytonematopsis contorta HA4267-MV1]|jgi:glycosyltransferase involved in cell wall biosynthesis|nr:glycosyltransferase [Scytonematopsis contorta HA4267-MV1]